MYLDEVQKKGKEHLKANKQTKPRTRPQTTANEKSTFSLCPRSHLAFWIFLAFLSPTGEQLSQIQLAPVSWCPNFYHPSIVGKISFRSQLQEKHLILDTGKINLKFISTHSGKAKNTFIWSIFSLSSGRRNRAIEKFKEVTLKKRGHTFAVFLTSSSEGIDGAEEVEGWHCM